MDNLARGCRQCFFERLRCKYTLHLRRKVVKARQEGNKWPRRESRPQGAACRSGEHVLHAGVSYADKHGIGVLSMRKLGQALGVEAMSLYNHVANKDELLDGMVDLVFAEIELPGPGGRMEDGHAPAGGIGPQGPFAPPLGHRSAISTAHLTRPGNAASP